jgi:hypothetical protein
MPGISDGPEHKESKNILKYFNEYIATLYLEQTSAFQMYFRTVCRSCKDPFPVGDITQCKSTVIRDARDAVELIFVAGGGVLIVLLFVECFKALSATRIQAGSVMVG